MNWVHQRSTDRIGKILKLMNKKNYECYIHKVTKTFAQLGFKGEDFYRMAKALKELNNYYGSNQCWDIQAAQQIERSFTSTHKYCPLYKGQNANELILSIYNIFPDKDADATVLMRRACCTDNHCVNPRHIFYGDKIDLKIQRWQRKGIPIDKYKFGQILWEYKRNSKNTSYERLAKEFDLNYNTVRSICNHV